MDSLLKSDIFFLITGAVVLIAGVLITIFLFYVIRITRDIKKISATAQKEAENIAQDIEGIRSTVKEEGMKSIATFFKGSKTTTRSKKKKD